MWFDTFAVQEDVPLGRSKTCTSIPSPRTIHEVLPLSREDEERILLWRRTIANILSKRDPRLLIIIGPCAIHRADAVLEYASKLQSLAKKFSDRFFIVMRGYVEKPRTRSDWNGYLYSHADESGNISLKSGITQARRLFLDLVRLGMPIAMEFVDPLFSDYLVDLVTWGSIGARTVYSPPHRNLVSRLPMPVGIKNSVDGSIDAAVQAMSIGREPHTTFGTNLNGQLCQIHSPGNPNVHLILRGGTSGPNYHIGQINAAAELLHHARLPEAILIDCSHGNSDKQFERQPSIFQYVLEECLLHPSLAVRGMMVESFLLGSTQQELMKNASNDYEREMIEYGASYVDGCLNWSATVELLVDAYDRCQRQQSMPVGVR
jgi:3-deoxy-7-phosphoheptulonate synthase